MSIHSKQQLDTPALCVDVEMLEQNIRSISHTLQQKQVNWRPHSKCHKSPTVGKLLLDAGAIGLTCAKLGEAEVMAAGGVRDILIANLIVGPQKVARLVELRRIADPVVQLFAQSFDQDIVDQRAFATAANARHADEKAKWNLHINVF